MMKLLPKWGTKDALRIPNVLLSFSPQDLHVQTHVIFPHLFQQTSNSSHFAKLNNNKIVVVNTTYISLHFCITFTDRSEKMSYIQCIVGCKVKWSDRISHWVSNSTWKVIIRLRVDGTVCFNSRATITRHYCLVDKTVWFNDSLEDGDRRNVDIRNVTLFLKIFNPCKFETEIISILQINIVGKFLLNVLFDYLELLLILWPFE